MKYWHLNCLIIFDVCNGFTQGVLGWVELVPNVDRYDVVGEWQGQEILETASVAYILFVGIQI